MAIKTPIFFYLTTTNNLQVHNILQNAFPAAWTAWESQGCSASCGEGDEMFTRSCVGAGDCEGDAFMTQPCEDLPMCGMSISIKISLIFC